MKNVAIVLFLVCLSYSCILAQKIDLEDQNHINYITDPSKPKTIGSGDPAEVLREADMSFEELVVGNGMQLYITSDNTPGILIAAQEALLPLISSEVSDKRLTLRLTASLETFRGIKVYVPIGKLAKITVKEGAYLHFPSIISKLNNIEILLQSGAFGDCDLNTEQLNCTVMGGATLNLSGSVHKHADITVLGGSVLNGKSFKCSSCNVTVLGASKCKLKVTELLNARVENESSFVYIGNPHVETSTTKLNGKIKHRAF